MNAKEQALFDNLCRVVVYFKADCSVKAGAAICRLIQDRIMEELEGR